MLLAAALWLGASLQLGPQVPAFSISYLGAGPKAPRNRPATELVEDLVAVPPERASTILFSGGFAFGGTAAVQAALDKAPGVRMVAFDSPGGRIGVASGIAQLIQDRHLATMATHYCASACTLAYVAGSPRLAGRKTVFAFHLGSGPILTDFVAYAAVMVEQPWFVRGKVSLSFANRALHAPNGAPYIADLPELVAAGYVQRIVPPPVAAPAARGPLTPLLDAVAKLEPATATAILWGQQSRPATDSKDADDDAELQAGLVVDRWLGRTSDAAATGLIDAELAVMDALQPADPKACMQWQVGVRDQRAGLAAIPPELRMRLRAAELKVLQDAAAHPQPLPTDHEALEAADRAVRDRIKQKYGERALIIAATREHGFDDPAQSCAAEADYLRGLRERPDAGRLIRWTLAAG